MTNVDSVLKSKDVTLPTKVCLVKAMVFPVVMYGRDSWTVKKAERWRIDAFLKKFKCIYFNWRLIALQYCIGFAIHQHESATGVHVFPILNPSLSSPQYDPSGSSQCTSPKHPVSCIEPGLAIRFIYDIIHVSMPFSQIIQPSPSPTESKRLFYTSVSLLLSRIQGYRYHLSKFHIYVLVYHIGVFLSGLLHSV